MDGSKKNPVNQTINHNNPSQGVPLLDLARQHGPLMDDFLASLKQVTNSGAFVLGPEVKKLEASLATYCQAKYAIGCASGSDALLLALMAFDIGPGDEVIVPSFTFFATASAVSRLGAKPVFADIDPATYNIDPKAIRRHMTSATKAILPVHLFGQCVNMKEIGKIADEAGIPVIEDAAQAIGAEYQGRRAGTLGAIGCFSFYPTKNLGGAGDGGLVTTNDDALAEKLTLLRGHGMNPRYYHKIIGINSRLDSYQAAILNVKLPHLEAWTEARRTNADHYHELFAEYGLAEHIGLPATSPECRHVWNQYVVRVPGGQRDELRAFLAEARIGSEIYYPLGLHQQECYRHLLEESRDLYETERAAVEVLALPIFPELNADEQRCVVERIHAFFSSRRGGHPIAAPKFLTHPRAKQKTNQ